MDRTIQRIFEIKVAEHYFEKTGETVFVPVRYFKPYYDLAQSKELSYELKFEAKANEPWNLCFEYSYKGEPSGLVSTCAIKLVSELNLSKEKLGNTAEILKEKKVQKSEGDVINIYGGKNSFQTRSNNSVINQGDKTNKKGWYQKLRGIIAKIGKVLGILGYSLKDLF